MVLPPPPVGDSLVSASCVGLDKLSVCDFFREAGAFPALIELLLQRDFGHGVFDSRKTGLMSSDW